MPINLNHLFSVLPASLRRRKLAKSILWFSPASKIQRVDFNQNARLYADISDRFPLTYFLTRSFDTEYLSIAAAFLKKGGHYFDVGAHMGFCTFGLLPLLTDAKVTYHLFEASQKSCDCLKLSTELSPEIPILINHAAVTDQKGMSQLIHKRGHASGSYLGPKGNEAVPNLCLDDYIQAHHLKSVDFMKIDIEGSEPAALRGAQTSLARGIVKALYFEVSAEMLSRYGEKIPEYLQKIRDFGFDIFFVKEKDLKYNATDASSKQTLNIYGKIFNVSPVMRAPDHYDTDLLAIHRHSGFLPIP